MNRKVVAGLAVAAALLLSAVAPDVVRAVGRDVGPNIPLNDAAGNFWSLATQPDASGNQQPIVAQAGLKATSTLSNGSVATGGTFQTALAANTARNGCLIQNTGTAALYVFLGATGATEAQSFQLAAGASFSCSQGQSVLTDEVQVTSGTAAVTFVVDAW